MDSNNASLDNNDFEFSTLNMDDYDEFSKFINYKIDNDILEVQSIEEEIKQLESPESLTKVISDEVWKQVANQLGLDITKETLIQKYDREHPEDYSIVKDKVINDKRYKDEFNSMKERQKNGNLKDEYTGNTIKRNEKANLDHVVSRKEIFENQRRKQANLQTEDLANKSENLKPTNESLNKSKQASSVKDYLKTREERESVLKEKNKKQHEKIDQMNISETEKRLIHEKIDKRLNDKLDADDKLMTKADKEARMAIGKDIAKESTKQVGKKAGKDALKQMAIISLSTLLKDVLNALVRFFKSQNKSFSSFLEEMKKSLISFFSKIVDFLKVGVSSVVGTIVSEIFGPIVSVFKNVSSFIKQGSSSFVDAIDYLRNPQNKNAPTYEKISQVGKIFVAGLSSVAAISFGGLFEKALLSVGFLSVTIPVFDCTLASIIGLFLSSLVCGIIGAVCINKIDRYLVSKQREVLSKEKMQKQNQILSNQNILILGGSANLQQQKEKISQSITERHNEASKIIQQSLNEIFNEENESNNDESFNRINDILNQFN